MFRPLSSICSVIFLPEFQALFKLDEIISMSELFGFKLFVIAVCMYVQCPTVEMVITKVRSIFHLPDIFLRIVE